VASSAVVGVLRGAYPPHRGKGGWRRPWRLPLRATSEVPGAEATRDRTPRAQTPEDDHVCPAPPPASFPSMMPSAAQSDELDTDDPRSRAYPGAAARSVASKSVPGIGPTHGDPAPASV
jgi:hypothetical protein